MKEEEAYWMWQLQLLKGDSLTEFGIENLISGLMDESFQTPAVMYVVRKLRALRSQETDHE